jgi:hypothetical protein
MTRPRRPRRKFSERKLLDLEAQCPHPELPIELERADMVAAAAEELCRVEGKRALSDLDEEEREEIMGRAESQLLAEGKILSTREGIERKREAVAEAEVRIAVWSYRAGYGNASLVAAALRNRKSPLSLDDCALIADLLDGKFKRGRGMTLAVARRKAEGTGLLRHAAYEVDRLQKQMRRERGGRGKRGDRNRAIDEVVKRLPAIVNEVFVISLLASDTPADLRGEVLIPWFEKKMSIRVSDLKPDDFKEKLHSMMKKRKAERLLLP